MKLPPLAPGEYHFKTLGRGIFARGQTPRPGQPRVRYGISYVLPAPIAQKFGVPRRRREYAGFTLRSARTLLAKRRTQMAEKDWSFLEPAPQTVPTLRQFAARYIEWAKGTKKSWTFDEARLKPFLARRGDRPLDAVLAAEVDQHKAARARDGISPRTVNHELQVIRLLFETAIRWNVLTRNPADRVRSRSCARKRGSGAHARWSQSPLAPCTPENN